jgi:hypothetical protein
MNVGTTLGHSRAGVQKACDLEDINLGLHSNLPEKLRALANQMSVKIFSAYVRRSLPWGAAYQLTRRCAPCLPACAEESSVCGEMEKRVLYTFQLDGVMRGGGTFGRDREEMGRYLVALRRIKFCRLHFVCRNSLI